MERKERRELERLLRFYASKPGVYLEGFRAGWRRGVDDPRKAKAEVEAYRGLIGECRARRLRHAAVALIGYVRGAQAGLCFRSIEPESILLSLSDEDMERLCSFCNRLGTSYNRAGFWACALHR